MKKTPLRRTSRPKARGKPIRKVNGKRRASEFAKRFGSRARVRAIKAMPCAICLRYGRTVNMHVKSRGAGGTWRDIVPACSTHHDEFHQCGSVWWAGSLWTYADLRPIAADLARTIPAEGVAA